MKYTSKDVQKLVDAFGNLAEKKSIKDITAEDILPLTEYPVEAVQVFLDSIEAMTGKHENEENYIKENYWGIIGYICIRMNICDPKPRPTDW